MLKSFRTILLCYSVGMFSPAMAADNFAINSAAGSQDTIRATETTSSGKIPHIMISAGNPAVTGSSGNVANAAAVATLTATATQRMHIHGFQCTGAGATAASVVVATVTGTITGTMHYIVPVPAGVTANLPGLNVSFAIPVPASAINTNIVVTMPALGAGNTNAACTAQGYLS